MLTHSLKSSFVKEFYRSITDPRSVDKYFMFYGGAKPRTDETLVPSTFDTVEYENSIKREIMFYNYVLPTDVSLMVLRYDWVSGTIYDQYEDDLDLITDKKFYVLLMEEDEFRVYMCVSNNGGVSSTYPPTGTSTQEIITSDGYVWKFMYSFTEAMEKFLTEVYMPIVPIDAVTFTDERALALDVKLDAVSGFIEKLTIDSASPIYTDLVNPDLTTSHLVGTADGLTFTVSQQATLSPINNYYANNYIVYFDSGKVGTIKTYVWGSNDITIELCEIYPNNDTDNGNIVVGDRFSILPKVNVVGNGYGAVVVPIFDDNQLIDFNIINGGTGYNYANAYLMAGDDVVVSVVIPPDGGYGFDLINELRPNYLMIRKDFKYSNIPTGNERYFSAGAYLRQYGIIKNIKTNNDFVVPNDYQSFNMTLVVDPDTVVSGQNYYYNDVLDFNIGTISANATHIFGADSMSSAKIDEITVSQTNTHLINLKLSEVLGVFENAELGQDGSVVLGEKIVFLKKIVDSNNISNSISLVSAPETVYGLTQSFVPVNLPINLRTSAIQRIQVGRTGSTILEETIVPAYSYLYREATETTDSASGFVVSIATATIVGQNSTNDVYILMEKGTFGVSDIVKCVKDPFAANIELYNAACAGNIGATIRVTEIAENYDEISVNKYSGSVLYTQNIQFLPMVTNTIFTTRILLGF